VTAEENGALPAGWDVKTIESLADPGGIAYGVLKPGPNITGGVPMLRVSDIRDGRVDSSAIYRIEPSLDEQYKRTKLHGGEVVLSIQGSVGRAAVVPKSLAGANISRTLAMIRLEEPRLARWVHRALESPQVQAAMRRAVGGTTRDSLNLRDLRKLVIPLAEAQERDRVLEHLDDVDARRASIADRLAAARVIVNRLRVAVLAAACSGRLTADWRDEHEGVASEAPDGPPASWEPTRLGDIVRVATGATPLRKNAAYYEGGTIPWITSGAVNAGIITEPTEMITTIALKETNVKLFPPGTLLIAMYGEGQTRGRVAELAIEACTNQALAAIVFDDTSAPFKRYLRLFFEDGYQRMRAASLGGVQPNLSLGVFKETVLPLPPLDEQRVIVERAAAALAIADRLRAAIASVESLLGDASRATVRRAFRGDLVPTEAEPIIAGDEPAREEADRSTVATP
jgi:type I restriction enzyme, S subunit